MKAHYALLAVLALTAACGKKSNRLSENDKVASCNMPSFNSCREYRGGNLALGTENLAKLCAIGNFKLTETACPTDKIVGVCKKSEGTDIYYAGYELADKMKESCTESGGTFTTN